MYNFIAHRGKDNHEYQENTIEAINYSLSKVYIVGVEFDIRMTRDKELVVIHDYVICRVSDGKGIVKNMSLKELQKYNFGNKKNPSRICTLNDVLKTIVSDKIIVIEIKPEFNREKEMANIIIKVLKRYKHLNILLVSFNNGLIDYIKDKYDGCKYGFSDLYPYQKNDFQNGYDAYCLNYIYFTDFKVNSKLFFWTINNQKFFTQNKSKITNNMYFITNKAYSLK